MIPGRIPIEFMLFFYSIAGSNLYRFSKSAVGGGGRGSNKK
jgi:hypothetical protein